MGHDFPLNQKQLLPLLDIMGTTNKHLKKVATFMRKFGDLDMFPVRCSCRRSCCRCGSRCA
jgi:hypothetical protein